MSRRLESGASAEGYVVIDRDLGLPVARLYNGTRESDKADAQLFAAAPELLAALTAVLAYVDDHFDINDNGGPNWAMRMAQELGGQVSTAIAKAIGGES